MPRAFRSVSGGTALSGFDCIASNFALSNCMRLFNSNWSSASADAARPIVRTAMDRVFMMRSLEQVHDREAETFPARGSLLFAECDLQSARQLASTAPLPTLGCA